jgi:hypothetical protein
MIAMRDSKNADHSTGSIEGCGMAVTRKVSKSPSGFRGSREERGGNTDRYANWVDLYVGNY